MELVYQNMLVHGFLTDPSIIHTQQLGLLVLLTTPIRCPFGIKKIAEIGVYSGGTSTLLRLGYPSAHLYLIDPWEINSEYENSDGPITKNPEHMQDAYHAICRQFEDDPFTSILRMPSLEAAKDVPNDLDLVIVDGNHDYEQVKQDILTWLPKLRSKGLMIGDDYYLNSDKFPGVKKAVHEIFSDHEITLFHRIWIYQKP